MKHLGGSDQPLDEGWSVNIIRTRRERTILRTHIGMALYGYVLFPLPSSGIHAVQTGWVSLDTFGKDITKKRWDELVRLLHDSDRENVAKLLVDTNFDPTREQFLNTLVFEAFLDMDKAEVRSSEVDTDYFLKMVLPGDASRADKPRTWTVDAQKFLPPELLLKGLNDVDPFWARSSIVMSIAAAVISITVAAFVGLI